ARSAAITAPGPASIGLAESEVTTGVRSVIAEAEAYPELKASAAFMDLQNKLTATEDGIEHARQFYNDAVYAYNTAAQTLPGSLTSGPKVPRWRTCSPTTARSRRRLSPPRCSTSPRDGSSRSMRRSLTCTRCASTGRSLQPRPLTRAGS